MECHTSMLNILELLFIRKRAIFGFSNNKIFYCFITACHVMPLLYNITPLFLTTSVQTKSILSRPDDLMCIKDYLFKYIFVYYIPALRSSRVSTSELYLFAQCLYIWCCYTNKTATNSENTHKICSQIPLHMHYDVDFGTKNTV